MNAWPLQGARHPEGMIRDNARGTYLAGERIKPGSRLIRAGVTTIEPRTWIACALIALLLMAVVALVAYLRHNSFERTYLRRRRRERQRHDKRMP